MSRQSPSKEDSTVPLSIVFTTVGAIILFTVGAIWSLAPATMPQPVYDSVGKYVYRIPVVPTLAAAARAPMLATPAFQADDAAETAVLLPESPAQTNAQYPDHFVSAAEAMKRDPGAGEPARIRIPRISVDAPVSEISLTPVQSNGETYYQWQVPNEYRIGWHEGTALLGKAGNTVLNGHHNIHGQVFRDLIELEIGDEIIIHDGNNQTFAYEITQKEIFAERDQPLEVRLQNAEWISTTEDERVTLVSCWPLTDNSHRLIVVAHPVDIPGG